MLLQIRLLTFLFCIGSCISCSIVSFDQLEIESDVQGYNNVFKKEEVTLQFSMTPSNGSVEKILVLRDEQGVLACKYDWNGRTLKIKPDSGWHKGGEYQLLIKGTIDCDDGPSSRVSFEAAWIQDSDSDYLSLLSVSPGSDHVFQGLDSILFEWSSPIDVDVFTSAISFSPPLSHKVDISNDGRLCMLTPSTPWKGDCVYEWKIEKMTAVSGFSQKVPVGGIVNTVVTNGFPEISVICPVEKSSGQWFTNLPLDGYMLSDRSIGIQFSHPMDNATVSAVRIEPSVAGYVRQTTSCDFQWVPLEKFIQGVRYCLIVSPSALDVWGHHCQEERREWFTSSLLPFGISSIRINEVHELINPSGTRNEMECNAIEGRLSAVIQFSSPIEEHMKQSVCDKITLQSYYPSSISYPIIESISWNTSSRELQCFWTGLTEGTTISPVYYLLRISGGKQGVSNGRGEYLEEDLCVYLVLR